MNLDWKNTGDGSQPYEAELPPIPGYTDEAGESRVDIYEVIPLHPDDYGYDYPYPVYSFNILIASPYYDGLITLNMFDFDVMEIGEWDDVLNCEWESSVDNVMSFVESLTPEDIADTVKADGYPPNEE